jgi:hypothetical protein
VSGTLLVLKHGVEHLRELELVPTLNFSGICLFREIQGNSRSGRHDFVISSAPSDIAL